MGIEAFEPEKPGIITWITACMDALKKLIPVAAADTPRAPGKEAAGVSDKYARADHVHPEGEGKAFPEVVAGVGVWGEYPRGYNVTLPAGGRWRILCMARRVKMEFAASWLSLE